MNEPPLSSAEERFEIIRHRAGFILAPALFLVVWFWPITGLAEPAHRLLAVIAAVVVLWITEALPLPVTALLGPVICLLVGALPLEPGTEPVRRIFRSFADPVIFLFLGSFLIAEAMQHHGLNRRIAFFILRLPGVGRSAGRLLLAFATVTGFISMWVSNTATTAMMFPIALAILNEMARRQSEREGRAVDVTRLNFGTAIMLVTAFAASVGGVATPVGTPPNLIGLGLIKAHLGVEISFLRWMSFGLPVAVVMILLLSWHLRRLCPADGQVLNEAGSSWIPSAQTQLGAMSRGKGM